MPNNPPLFESLPTPDEMRGWDNAATDMFAIPSLLLMENAARAAYAELKRLACLTRQSRILICAGRGNNGGDGMALARLLHDDGYTVLVWCATDPEIMPSPAREHAVMARNVGVNLFVSATATPPPEWRCPDIVVDALLGTGVKGTLKEPELGMVRAINCMRSRAFLFALDIPSGLCGLTGKPLPEAVRAHATICFEAGKPGVFFPEAVKYTGQTRVCRVGIPLAVRVALPPSWKLLSPKKGAWALPSPFQHKGKAGTVLVVGGSAGMAGAPVLAALGSLRTGAGLVHVAIPAALEEAVRASWPEMLTHRLGSGSSWSTDDANTLVDLVASVKPDAIVVGMGMGRTKAVRLILKTLLEQPDRPPLVLDADALFFVRLSGASASARSRSSTATQDLPLHFVKASDILTPHPGELARMLPDTCFLEQGLSDSIAMPERIQAVQQNRSAALRAFTSVCRGVLTLKGSGTLIGQSNMPTVLAPFAVSALGVGGAGDVLAGICAALLGMGFASHTAACLAVHLHGRAGELLYEQAPRGHAGRNIADTVPLVWKELCASTSFPN